MWWNELHLCKLFMHKNNYDYRAPVRLSFSLVMLDFVNNDIYRNRLELLRGRYYGSTYCSQWRAEHNSMFEEPNNAMNQQKRYRRQSVKYTMH